LRARYTSSATKPGTTRLGTGADTDIPPAGASCRLTWVNERNAFRTACACPSAFGLSILSVDLRQLPRSSPIENDRNKIEASFQKGILTVTLPKTPEARKAEKKIEVKAG